jgi:hypothetical protein
LEKLLILEQGWKSRPRTGLEVSEERGLTNETGSAVDKVNQSAEILYGSESFPRAQKMRLQCSPYLREPFRKAFSLRFNHSRYFHRFVDTNGYVTFCNNGTHPLKGSKWSAFFSYSDSGGCF